jgi:hypothetical protein
MKDEILSPFQKGGQWADVQFAAPDTWTPEIYEQGFPGLVSDIGRLIAEIERLRDINEEGGGRARSSPTGRRPPAPLIVDDPDPSDFHDVSGANA